MSSVYSTLFFRIHQPGEADYVVPDGYIAVVRCITVTWDIEALVGYTIITLGDGTMVWTVKYSPLETPYSNILDCRVVLNAGDSIGVDGGNPGDVTCSGYLLTAP